MPLIRIPPSVLHIKYQGQAPLVSGKQKRYGLSGDGFNQLELQRDSVSSPDRHGSTPLQGFKSGVRFTWKDPYKYTFVFVYTCTLYIFKSVFLFCLSVGGLHDLSSEMTSSKQHIYSLAQSVATAATDVFVGPSTWLKMGKIRKTPYLEFKVLS